MADIKSMYGKIKNVKAIASKALGQVDLDTKVLKQDKPVKANIEVETKTSKNATSESVEGKEEIKSKILAKLGLKKVAAKTEVPVTKSKLVEECTEVKKVPTDATKAQKAKALANAKKADAKETEVK